MAEKNANELMEDVQIIFKNFAGKEGMYNREGDRNFAVLLDDDRAQELARNGWNVKTLKKRDDDDPNTPPQSYIQVSVSYKGRPPRIVLVTSKGRTTLTEDELELLDWADIRTVDLIINPYHWNVSGNTGVKAYAKSVFVTIEEDPLEQKYADVPELGGNALESGPSQRMLELESSKPAHFGEDGDLDIVDAELVD